MKKPRNLIHLRSEEIDQAVRALYAKNGYTVLSQVRNGTGYSRSVRTADVLAISTWPSRGLFAEGIEIKISDGDLRRELANPSKADEIGKACKYWWLATPQGLIRPEHLIPEKWGIVEVDEKLKATVTKKAQAIEAAPMDVLFVCAVLRNFAETHVHRSEITAELQKIRDEERKAAEGQRQSRLDAFERAFKEFKETTGIDLLEERTGRPKWDIGNIGEAVNVIIALRHTPQAAILEASSAFDLAAKALHNLGLDGRSGFGRALIQKLQGNEVRP